MFPIFAGNSASTGYNLTRSLRIRRSATAYLSRTPATTGTGGSKTWTYSLWVKRGVLGVRQVILDGYAASAGHELEFGSNDILEFASWGGAAVLDLATTQVFRDPSAWYHIVLAVDTTQATAANRMKLYVNGSQVTAFGVATYPALNALTYIGSNVLQEIGRRGDAQFYFDGYTTEVNFVDGQQLTPSSFGSTNAATGVWQPAAYTGSYGTNGFELNFTDNSALTTSSNVGLGKDFSGNGNYWTTNNISITAGVTYDSMTDVPTLTSATAANYCVLNTLDGTNMSYITVSNANLTYSEAASASGWRAIRGTIGVTTGKYRFSVYGVIGASTRMQLGLCTSATDLGSYNVSQNIGVQYNPYDGGYYVNGTFTTYSSTQRITAVFDFIFDAATGKCWVAVNGTLLGGNPDAGTGEMATFTTTSPVFPVTQAYGSSWDVNFGQRPWDYTIATASGFVALNTYNLPTSTIVKGGSVMNAVTWTGASGGTNLNVTGFGFQPDFVWGKTRNQAYDHYLQDSVRGITNGLSSNLTAAESTTSGSPTSFIADGFNISSTAGWTSLGNSIVTWAWKAGQGTNTSNTNGTITSTVSVNASAGFSVVTYTGTGGASATVGHGLGVTPSLIIVKERSSNVSGWNAWTVYHSSIGATGNLVLNTTAATNTAIYAWNNTAPTSSVFTIAYSAGAGVNYTSNYVAYCWTPIAGFSAFGSYTGNGSTDGPFVYTGFRPKFILFKAASNVADWGIYDTARNTYNVVSSQLDPNGSSAEYASTRDTDILSNGFKVRNSNGGMNTNGNTYIYAAFAENPLKNALAR